MSTHEHNATHACNCENHDSPHHDGCGCHHHDEHNHDTCGCGCGSHSHEQKPPVPVFLKDVSELETEFLTHLMTHRFLPVAQYVVKSTKESAFESIALTPVHMQHVSQTMEEVRAMGAMLTRLSDLGWITLDFDLPLTNYPYEEYHKADLFAYFQQTVEEAKAHAHFLGDTAVLECGSIAPTESCIQAFEAQ